MRFYFFSDVNGEQLLERLTYNRQHYNEMILKYRDYIQHPRPREYGGIFDSEYMMTMHFAERHPEIKRDDVMFKTIPRKKIIYIRKFDFLIHLLIKRTIYEEFKQDEYDSQIPCIQITADDFEAIFYNEYLELIQILLDSNIIATASKNHSKAYRLLREDWKEIELPYVNEYSEFCKREQKVWDISMKKVRAIIDESVRLRLGDLYEPYLKTLSCIQYNQKGMEECVENFIKEPKISRRQRYYYEEIIKRYSTKEYNFQNVDSQYRIYTILTQTPSRKHSLLKFVNINYEVDVCNSQPLMLNYFLKMYYSCDFKSFLEKVDSFSQSTPLSPIFPYLADIEGTQYDNLPNDVKEYIQLTSEGKLWDTFLKQYEHEKLDRKQIKKKCFSQIFYSNLLHIPKTNRYAKDFEQRFPNVMRMILRLKQARGNILSRLLTLLESHIIQATLRQLYQEGFAPLNIHDAIVILDIPENYALSEKHVQELMSANLLTYGLHGKTKAEFFGEEWKC